MGRPVSNIRFAFPAAILAALAVILLVSSSTAQAVTLNPGDLVVVDEGAFSSGSDTGAVFKVDAATGLWSTISSGGYFTDPYGVAMAPNGDILVVDPNGLGGCPADLGCGGVIRVNPMTGAQSIVSSGGYFVDPYGIAVAADGSILVADTSAVGPFTGAIIRIDALTGIQTIVSSGGNLMNPFALAIASNGDIFVTNHDSSSEDYRITRIDPVSGAQSPASFGAQFGDLSGIAVEATGSLVGVDQGRKKIIRVDPNTGAETTLSTNGFMDRPYGIAVDPSGTLFVAETNTPSLASMGGVIRIDPVTGSQTLLGPGSTPSVNPVAVAVVVPVAAVVPEPASLMLMASGLAVLGLAGLRGGRRPSRGTD